MNRLFFIHIHTFNMELHKDDENFENDVENDVRSSHKEVIDISMDV